MTVDPYSAGLPNCRASAYHRQTTKRITDNEKFTVRSAPARLPRRKPNAEYRSREHLTEREVGG